MSEYWEKVITIAEQLTLLLEEDVALVISKLEKFKRKEKGWLIHDVVNQDLANNWYGNLLHICVYRTDDVSLLQLLIKMGGDLYATDYYGNTVVRTANNHYPVIVSFKYDGSIPNYLPLPQERKIVAFLTRYEAEQKVIEEKARRIFRHCMVELTSNIYIRGKVLDLPPELIFKIVEINTPQIKCSATHQFVVLHYYNGELQGLLDQEEHKDLQVHLPLYLLP